jgi:hypothetical protein
MKAANAIIAMPLFAVIALAAAGVCQAQQAVTPPSGKAVVDETKMEEEKKSWISGSMATDVTNEYIFAGLVQDKDTVIIQPYLDLSFSLYEGAGAIDAVSFELPLWWSFHDINKPQPPNGHSSLKDWFEFDISPGFSFTIAKRLTFTISDYIYTSPGDYFDTSHNLSLAFEYDDADLLGAFALNPHFYFLQELNNHSGLGLKGDTESQYYEVGIEPSYIFGDRETYPVTVSFPTAVGFGTNGYYGQGFGYFNTGARVSIPLAFIPPSYGSWTASLTGQYWRLGTDPARITDNPNNTSSGRRNQAVVTWSIGMDF